MQVVISEVQGVVETVRRPHNDQVARARTRDDAQRVSHGREEVLLEDDSWEVVWKGDVMDDRAGIVRAAVEVLFVQVSKQAGLATLM